MKRSLKYVFFIFVCTILLSVNAYAQGTTKTADDYYSIISQFGYSQPYQALDVAVEANSIYPNDTRFIDVILSRSKEILEWSEGSQSIGDFNAAIYGYDNLIKVTQLPDYFTSLIVRDKDLALNKKQPLTADQYYSMTSQFTYSQAYQELDLLKEANFAYPNDQRFINEINYISGVILDWSESSHKAGDFAAAINGYQTIINTPNAAVSIKNEAQEYLTYAKENKIYYTADEYNEMLSNYSYGQAYQALALLVRANSDYPNDQRFINGLNYRAGVILDWSISSHKAGDFAAAINGYQTIINTPNVAASIKNEAQEYLAYAKENKIYYTADEYNEMISNYSYGQAYQALALLAEANSDYPNDQRFIDGINYRANEILDWSQSSQNSGNFNAAINGYQTIINTPNVSDSIKSEAERCIIIAKENHLYYTENEYNTMLSNYGYGEAYQALAVLDDANILYPDNQSYIDGINYRAGIILDWSITAHRNSNFNVAIYGYQTIANLQNVSQNLKDKASIYLLIAKEGIPYNDNGKYMVQSNYNETLNDFVNVEMTKSPQTDKYGNGWQNASAQDVEYYIDPDNFINSDSIYQFLILSGQAGVTADDLNNILANKGVLANTGAYFIEAASEYNINEIYLVSHALLETGNGTSALAKGVQYNGKTVYNMFGIGAFDSDPITLGAKYAYQNGWFTPESAIVGGAEFISKQYINNTNYNQDTLYKMRWDPANPGVHQYATDIAWAVKQINSIETLYQQCKNYILRFDIPNFLTSK